MARLANSRGRKSHRAHQGLAARIAAIGTRRMAGAFELEKAAMPRDEYLTYWKCSKCRGTGKAIPIPGHVETCSACDGTGNALVDGRARAHAREVERIERESGTR